MGPLVSCGNTAGIGRARLCLVVPIATGVPWQVVELKVYLERSTELIMPGSIALMSVGAGPLSIDFRIGQLLRRPR